MKNATVTLIREIVGIYYTCPHCGRVTCETLEEFQINQNLNFRDFPDWKYETIICPACKQEIEPTFELD